LFLIRFYNPPHFDKVSEFGASVTSSFESISSTISQEYWSLHGDEANDECAIIFENLNECNGTNVMAQRNYPCDSLIKAYFGEIKLNEVGEKPFRRQLYMCMIAQSLWLKLQIETQRNNNIFGLLIWQLNENWPTGGWGLVEYGSHDDEVGQVIGGRWKPSMYLLKNILYRDIIAVCPDGGQCYCRNDGRRSVATVHIEKYDFVNNIVAPFLQKRFVLEEGEVSKYSTSKAYTMQFLK
jgi:hypothetical protein